MDFFNKYHARQGFYPTVREICAALGLASPGSLQKHLRALEEEGRLTRTPGKKRTWKPTRNTPLRGIPLLGRIAAGTPLLAEENRDAELPVDPSVFGCDSTFALTVRGDSMIGVHIQDGDLAIIRPQEEVEEGQVAAVLVEGTEPEATLKIVRRRRDRVELHPANPEYSPLVFTGVDQARIRILGRLVGVIRTRAHQDRLFPCAGRFFTR